MKNIIFVIASALILSLTANAQTKKAVPAAQPPARKMVTPGYSPATVSSPSIASSWGHGFQNEFDLNLSEGYFKTYKVGSKSYTDFNVFGAYSYDLGQNIQVGGDVGLRSYDSSTRITLVATGTYNIEPNYADSVFFKAGLGLYPIDKGSNGNTDIKSEFGLYVAAGKRFKLWDHVNYKPMVKIAKISDLDAEITIQFLNVSVNWN
ncbi:MAG: outer membrane beta-barrel protein [Bdellovibrio sp.]|nr:outer membrane beta-barrel protein [Bdellovibrio sp.]